MTVSTASAEAAGEARDGPVLVEVLDIPATRVRHPSDLLAVVLSALGLLLVLVLATFAQNTTTGVAEDVRTFASVLGRVLFVPVNVLVALVTLLVPVGVLADLAIRRRPRLMLETAAAAAAAAVLNGAAHWALVRFATPELVRTMSVWLDGSWQLTLPGYVAAVAGLLTLAGPRSVRRSVRWSWNALWMTVAITLVTAQVSLPGVGISLLIGRLAGMGLRYLTKVEPQRAYGDDLVAGVRQSGFHPVALTRVPDAETHVAAAHHPDGAPDLPEPAPASVALARTTRARVYQVRTVDDEVLDLVVLDGDRQVVGLLTRAWRSLRLRGIEGRSVVSLRQATERAALLAYAARAAGVRTPRLLRIGAAADSMLLIQEHPTDSVPLADLDPADLTDELMRSIWAQLLGAHRAGIAHRAVTSDVLLVAPPDASGHRHVWLTGWELGDVASSELARRIDVTQLLALLAARVGAERAVRSAAHAMAGDDLAAVGPLLQPISLPRRTREEIGSRKEVLADLRTQIVARLPEADVEPQRLVRFGARTVLTILITVVAAFVILTTINVRQIGEALATSDWRYSLLAYGLGLATLVASALTLVAFSPVKFGLWRATLVQTAGTFVALATPAGIGPAALNLRAMTRRGVSTSLATATVALIQVSQFVMTVVVLVVLMVTSGTQQQSVLPLSPTVLIVVAAVVALVAATLLVPAVRQWISARAMPTVRQTWPRFIEVVGQPKRVLMGLAGNVAMTLGYVLAFDASLTALGQHVSLVQVAIVYLLGTTLGSVVPTPGGVGTVEAALAAGLGTVAGLNPGVAFSVAVLFRVLTYWLRIPLGWAAMRGLQRIGEL